MTAVHIASLQHGETTEGSTRSAYWHAAGVSAPVYASQMARTKSSVSYPVVQLYHSPPSRMHTGTPSIATVHDLLRTTMASRPGRARVSRGATVRYGIAPTYVIPRALVSAIESRCSSWPQVAMHS